jgi:hypothetical protein
MYSFPKQYEKDMTYAEFLEKLQNERRVGTIALKDSRKDTGLFDKILSNITAPEFYHDISELDSVELLQGGFLIDKPKYEKTE